MLLERVGPMAGKAALQAEIAGLRLAAVDERFFASDVDRWLTIASWTPGIPRVVGALAIVGGVAALASATVPAPAVVALFLALFAPALLVTRVATLAAHAQALAHILRDVERDPAAPLHAIDIADAATILGLASLPPAERASLRARAERAFAMVSSVVR